MIVTTDLGLRYHVEELARGQFQVRMLNPEDRPPINPWMNWPTEPCRTPIVVSSLSLKIGDPLAFFTFPIEQVPPSKFKNLGFALCNLITAIEP